MGFSKNLCFLMAEKNVSKYRLAKDIDCSQSSVKNWRDGTVIPHPRARQKIADYFGITLAELDGDELPTLPENSAKKAPGINAEGFVPTMKDWEEQAENWTDDQILQAMQKLVEIQQRRRSDGR